MTEEKFLSRVKLWFIGLLPIVLGYLITMMNQSLGKAAPASWLVGLLFLSGWIILGYLSAGIGTSALQSTLWSHYPGLLAFMYMLLQDILQPAYQGSLIETISIPYFLPIQGLTNYLPTPENFRSITAGISLILMFLAYFWGAHSRIRFNNKNSNN